MTTHQQAMPGHGMTHLESEVMERFEGGDRVSEISRAVGISQSRVMQVVYAYRENRGDRWEDDARRGSRELLAAIRRLQMRAAA